MLTSLLKKGLIRIHKMEQKITRKTVHVSESDKVKDSIMIWQKVEQKVHQNVITFLFEP